MRIELSAAERRELKARAHHLDPKVIIGDAGLTPAIEREVDIALRAHELVKVRVAGDDREMRLSAATALADSACAALVGTIGKLLILYRPRPPEPPREIVVPNRLRGSKKQVGNRIDSGPPGTAAPRKAPAKRSASRSSRTPAGRTAAPRNAPAKRSQSRGLRTPAVRATAPRKAAANGSDSRGPRTPAVRATAPRKAAANGSDSRGPRTPAVRTAAPRKAPAKGSEFRGSRTPAFRRGR
ncbi:MAG: YhbY family RNA-binding protein [Burkholderiales bacterium]